MNQMKILLLSHIKCIFYLKNVWIPILHLSPFYVNRRNNENVNNDLIASDMATYTYSCSLFCVPIFFLQKKREINKDGYLIIKNKGEFVAIYWTSMLFLLWKQRFCISTDIGLHTLIVITSLCWYNNSHTNYIAIRKI